jgi:hypothetical protein
MNATAPHDSPVGKLHACRKCGRHVVTVRMHKGPAVACDPLLVEGKWARTLVVLHKGAGALFPMAPGSVTGRVPHTTTCPHADARQRERFSRPAKLTRWD